MVVATQRVEDDLIVRSLNASNRNNNGNLRILIDARKLGDGGIGSYTENLLIGLSTQPGISVTALVNQSFKENNSLPENIATLQDDAPLYSLNELFLMPRRINFNNFDLFHVPHYTLPFFVGIPTVVTVHDLIHITHPQKWYYPFISRILVRSALKRASRIITVSQSSKDQIERVFGIRSGISQKINVVPNIISSRFLSSSSNKVSSSSGVARRSGKYLLAVISNLKPHKGLSDLLQAFELVLESLKRLGKSNDLRLIIAGQAFRFTDASDRILKEMDSVRGVHLAGEVTQDELRDLYTRALAVVVPSTVEGFCMPVIEAHACGVPVIARPVPAIKEITTHFDSIASDMSVSSLATAIVNLIERSKEENLKIVSETLLSSLDRFEIDKVSQAVLNVYREVFLNK